MMLFRRALFRLYPASFRADYGAELERTMAELPRERGRIGAAMAALADVIPNALAAHRDLLAQDLRYMARTLARSKGFAIATILITALGVGANTATFSVADFVLLRPLPYPASNELVRLCGGPRTGAGWGCYNQLSPANWRDVRERNRSFTGLGALAGTAVNLVGAGEPVRIAGAAVAVYAVPLLSHLVPSTLPIASRPSVDLRVFAFAAAFAALTGIGFGLIPALRVGGHTGFGALRVGARGGGGMRAARLRAVLVSVEVAVSVVLLISSGLLIRAMWQVQAVGTGFTTESVLTLRTALPGPTYQDSVRRADVLRRVIAGVRALPDVEAASRWRASCPACSWRGWPRAA